MVRIDKEKCVGCGACVRDCSNRTIYLDARKRAEVDPNVFCMMCGHCYAICPVNAVEMVGMDCSEVQEGGLKETALDPELLLRAIKGRRTIRHFQRRPVEREKIDRILAAAHYTPTGGNRQPLSYTVVQETLPELTRTTLEALKELGEKYLADPNPGPVNLRYGQRFGEIHREYFESGGEIDRLFYHAPVVITICGDGGLDAGLAASNMELMAYAQGLGMMYVGFLVRAAAASGQVSSFLRVPKGSKVSACIALGYPDVDYRRSVPRNPLKVHYL